MKPFAIAVAALLSLPSQPASAEAPESPPSAALVDRFIAVLPDRDAIGAAGEELDAAELSRLVALNPGKEAQLRVILQRNVACTGPEIVAGSLRMFRTVAGNLGAAKVRRLIAFYEGPDYAAFAALAARTEGNPAPSPKDKLAMDKLLRDYPLQALNEQLSKAGQIFAADQAFIGAAMKCATEQRDAMTTAGLKAN